MVVVLYSTPTYARRHGDRVDVCGCGRHFMVMVSGQRPKPENTEEVVSGFPPNLDETWQSRKEVKFRI